MGGRGRTRSYCGVIAFSVDCGPARSSLSLAIGLMVTAMAHAAILNCDRRSGFGNRRTCMAGCVHNAKRSLAETGSREAWRRRHSRQEQVTNNRKNLTTKAQS